MKERIQLENRSNLPKWTNPGNSVKANDLLRERILELEAANRQLERELVAARMAKISGDGTAARERLREAINTPHSDVIVRNDDVFDVLWRSSLDRQKLREITQ